MTESDGLARNGPKTIGGEGGRFPQPTKSRKITPCPIKKAERKFFKHLKENKNSPIIFTKIVRVTKNKSILPFLDFRSLIFKINPAKI
ncbi:MAG: hypothetical protein ACUVUD_07520 [bacterium]